MMLSYLLLGILPLIYCKFVEENKIKVLDGENFATFLKSSKRVYVLFQTQDCRHCEKFLEQIEKAVFLLEDDSIPFGKIDLIKYKDAIKKHEVNGYPRLIYFENGQRKADFNGTKSYDAVQMFYYEQINPGSKYLATIKDVRRAIEQETCIFIFFGESEDRSFRRFREFSLTMGNAVFAHTFANGATQALGFNNQPQVVAFKKYDKSPVVFSQQGLKLQDLKQFVELNIIPRVSDWSEEIEKRIFKKNRDAFILFTQEDDTDITDVFQKAADVICLYQQIIYKDYPLEDYLLFIKISPLSVYWNALKERFGVWKEQITESPKLLMLKSNGTKKYEYNKDFTQKNIDQFIFEVRMDKLPRYYKSAIQIIPIKELPNLTVLNAQKYHSELNESGLDWIIVYYDENEQSQYQILIINTTLSKGPLTVINRVAQKLSKNKNIIFGITDVSKNEYNDFDEQLDTIKIRLYKGAKGDKQFKKFTLKTNKIQEERLTNFIFEHTRLFIILQFLFSYDWVKEEL